MLLKMNFLLLIGLIFCIYENEILAEAKPREPSIQAYGLPKRFPAGNNGHIERVRLDDKNEWQKSKDTTSASTGTTRRKFEPTTSYDDAGIIEIFHLDSSPTSSSRNIRSVDLEAQESKVFRPLFAYRKQLEAKQRNSRSERARRNNLPPPYSKNKKATQFPHNCAQSK